MTENEQRRFEILLEQVLREVRTVAEGHEVLRKEIKDSHDHLDEKINLNTSLIKHGVETLDAKIGSVREELKEEIRAVDKRSEARDAELEARLTAEIRAVDKRSEARDAELEARLTAEIRAVGEKVDGHEERIAGLEQKVG